MKEYDSIEIKVTDYHGNGSTVKCVLTDHPTQYGNGKCVVMTGRTVLWGKALLDTRYIDIDKEYGGFEEFCKYQIEHNGYGILN